MALIELHGKYARGDAKYTIVDDDDFARLNAYRWRARPSRNTVYASRSEYSRISGRRKNGQVQMHREVLGLTICDKVETDHRNHNGLDNRKNNLRIATRSVNQRNRIVRKQSAICEACGKQFDHEGKAGKPRKFCGGACKSFAPVSLRTPNGQKLAEQMLAVLDGPLRNTEIAKRSGMKMPPVWRILPQLVSIGKIRLIGLNPHVYERVVP